MKHIQWFVRHQWWSLGGILVLFSAIALGNMTRWSIWFDEAFSIYIIRFNFGEIARFTGLDVHPPLYYWVLKAWTMLWGSTTPLTVRSLSLVWALIALVGVYILVRRVFNSRSYALIATLGAALTPLLIRYTDEARMYTMAFAIVVWASYTLLRAMAAKTWKWWIIYGVLVMVGMLTHYLIALVWITHWIWRWYVTRRDGWKAFFSRQWIGSHVLAVGLFAWWLPTMIQQFRTVQGGFWIPPITLVTPFDYLSNSFLYRMTYETEGWWAVAATLVVGIVITGIVTIVRRTDKTHRAGMLLLLALATLPPVLLMLLSMPPFKSTFVDRYTLYSASLLIGMAAVGLMMGVKTRPRRRQASIAIIILVVGLISGIANVYQLGNLNKNRGSNVSIRTAETIKLIDMEGIVGQPIICASPWLYYEAAAYESSEHPVYFTQASITQNYGSLAMLKESNMGKIRSLDVFTKSHRYVWFFDNPAADAAIVPPVASWKTVKSVGAYDSITKTTRYRAVLYDTQG